MRAVVMGTIMVGVRILRVMSALVGVGVVRGVRAVLSARAFVWITLMTVFSLPLPLPIVVAVIPSVSFPIPVPVPVSLSISIPVPIISVSIRRSYRRECWSIYIILIVL
jgi:hypothetical protein